MKLDYMLETPKAQKTTKVKLFGMLTMDNQQQRTLDLAWLGGIIDGEGCVTATIGHTHTSKGHVARNRRYIPLICIVNTDPVLVERALAILRDNGLAFHVYDRIQPKHPTWKRKWEIMINGMKRCRRAIEVLAPYVFSEKRKRMDALLNWIDYRLVVDPKKPYTTKDCEMLSIIRQSPVLLRDYTSSPAASAGEDIVQR